MAHINDAPGSEHYHHMAMQPIEFIRINRESLDPLQAAVIKYVCRFKHNTRHPGAGLEDLAKARRYLDWLEEDYRLLANEEHVVRPASPGDTIANAHGETLNENRKRLNIPPLSKSLKTKCSMCKGAKRIGITEDPNHDRSLECPRCKGTGDEPPSSEPNLGVAGKDLRTGDPVEMDTATRVFTKAKGDIAVAKPEMRLKVKVVRHKWGGLAMFPADVDLRRDEEKPPLDGGSWDGWREECIDRIEGFDLPQGWLPGLTWDDKPLDVEMVVRHPAERDAINWKALYEAAAAERDKLMFGPASPGIPKRVYYPTVKIHTNSCTEACDVVNGPCACGSFHDEWDWIERLERHIMAQGVQIQELINGPSASDRALAIAQSRQETLEKRIKQLEAERKQHLERIEAMEVERGV